MAIRLVHQPTGIGGLAAYAAGRGQAQERQRKYATDLILSQQARQDRYNLQANQQAFQLARDEDQRAFYRERDEELDKLQRERLKYQYGLMGERDEAQFKRESEQQSVQGARGYAQSLVDALEIPSWATVDQQQEMRRKIEAARGFLDPSIDLRPSAEEDINTLEGSARSQFEEAIAEARRYRDSLKPPSAAEQAQMQEVWRDQSTMRIVDPGKPGALPYDLQGRPIQAHQQPEQPEQIPPIEQFNRVGAERKKAIGYHMEEYDYPADREDWTAEHTKRFEEFKKTLPPMPSLAQPHSGFQGSVLRPLGGMHGPVTGSEGVRLMPQGGLHGPETNYEGSILRGMSDREIGERMYPSAPQSEYQGSKVQVERYFEPSEYQRREAQPEVYSQPTEYQQKNRGGYGPYMEQQMESMRQAAKGDPRNMAPEDRAKYQAMLKQREAYKAQQQEWAQMYKRWDEMGIPQ